MSSKRLLVCIAVLAVALASAGAGAKPAKGNAIEKLRIDYAVAYKYKEYQPIDVIAEVVDVNGDPVNDAIVVASYPGAGKVTPLKGAGKGSYAGCDIGYATDTQVITIKAEKSGMMPVEISVKTQPGNMCGKGESELYVSTPVAAKLDGKKQPLDLYVDIRDEAGKAVAGAKVMARATDFQNFVDAPLVDVGNGRYMACTFGYFSGNGPGAVRVHIRVDKPGYLSGQSDGQNEVGRLCPLR